MNMTTKAYALLTCPNGWHNSNSNILQIPGIDEVRRIDIE